jgi:diacylglycerol kinase family enzyme
MKRPTVVLLNRGGGTIAADPKIRSKVAAAFKAAGLDAKIELIGGEKCEVRCKALAKRGDELVVVGGGDGTISAAASALVGTDTLLGILPLGTLNHFARDLGIPTVLKEAAGLIAERPQRRVDVAEMNDRIFINNSAIGLYPLLVVDRDAQRKRLGRPKAAAMIVATVRMLVRFGHQRLTLTTDDRKGRVDTPLLFVGNNDYRTDLLAAGERASLEDGKLCVLVMRKKTRRGFVAASIRALLDRSRPDDMVRLDDAETLRVESRKRMLAVSLDGEVVRAKTPLNYRIRKRALNVIARPSGRKS